MIPPLAIRWACEVKMKKNISIILIVFLHLGSTWANLNNEKEIQLKEISGVPQAPRLSKDKQYLVFEVASGSKTELWLTDMNTMNSKPLTSGLQKSGKLPAIVENASWHPTQNILVFEARKEANEKSKIFVAALSDGKLGDPKSLVVGRRAQFSKPHGHVLFMESYVVTVSGTTDSQRRKLSYFIVGANPLDPIDVDPLPLRGPIENTEAISFTHPALSQDGSSIYFAAENAIINGGSFVLSLNIDSATRQRVMEQWEGFVSKKYAPQTIAKALIKIAPDLAKVDAPLSLKNFGEYSESIRTKVNEGIKTAKNTPSGLGSLNQRDLIIFWVLGLLEQTNLTTPQIKDLLATKIWQTNIFGGGIKQVVTSGAPLPQKYPTASPDSDYVVFEAGHFKDRQLYVVDVKTGKALKLTTLGSYNSSPEMSADGKSIIYETNRTGKKSLFVSHLDWDSIKQGLKK